MRAPIGNSQAQDLNAGDKVTYVHTREDEMVNGSTLNEADIRRIVREEGTVAGWKVEPAHVLPVAKETVND